MAKFSIIPNGGGEARYSGCPTFTGTYMKPGLLEFREIYSPTPINWEVGDYVVYTRTGFTYRLYSVPQVKKQARATEYGGAFIYQNVQFYDDSKQLEICPFRDLVLGDNRIHFSTQPEISTFEAVDGIARRIQACLDDMYPNTWVVQLATTAMGASQDLVDLMAEAREFSVSGVSLLEALDKVYEIWPEVGWTYSYNSTTGKNVITIGGAGLSSTASYQYGKGNGLRSITKNAANADELATRLFAYGSSRNMLPRWYNNQNIKDAESVDIQNLMIPISEWGETDNLPDPAKAFVENTTSTEKNGLRPATVYFDGSGDYPEIYPSIRETTIGMVRTAIGDSTAQYYPSTTIYNDSDARIDKLLSAQATFDSGLAGDVGKSAAVSESEVLGNLSGSGTVAGGSNTSVILATRTFTMTKTSQTDFFVSITGDGTITPSGGSGVVDLAISIQKGDGTNFTEIKRQLFELEQDENGVFHTYPVSTKASGVSVVSGDVIRVYLSVFIMNTSSTTLSYSYSISPGFNFSAEFSRKKTFNISVRQLGFDIEAQANLGEGKTIAMRSGKCAGRSFSIKSVQYDATTDSWALECWRSEDESLSQWFPNTDYPIEADDEFVLLDIAMPDIYISMAEQRLLLAAQELLADVSVERWQYIPEIDAKFMVESGRSILPAQNMVITDSDVVGSSPESILIDTVTISEGEAAIPTYKVTLRDRKRKTFTEAKGADSISSKPVSNATQEEISSLQGGGDSFFQLDENGNVTLKPQYQNLWVSGWMAAGGIGSQGGGGGGGGLITSVRGVADLGTSIPTESLTETFSAKAIETIWEAVLDLQQGTSNVSLVNGASYSTLTVNGTSANFYTKAQVDGLIGSIEQFHYEIYASTSAVTNPQGNILYLIGPTGSGSDKYEEYVYANNSWTKIGDTTIDLSGYATESWVQQQGYLVSSDLSNYALKAGSWTYNFQVNSLILSGGTLTGPNAISGAHRLVYTYTIGGASIDDPGTTVQKTVAYLDDIPASLKNPYSLTFGSKTYDGSSAETISASDLDAVTISGTQTVTGAKTFSTGLVTGGDIYPSSDLGSSLGYGNRRFLNGNIQTIGTSTIYLKNSSSGNSGFISAGGGYLVLRAGSNIDSAYKQLSFHETYGFYPETSGVNLGYNGVNYRWATIYGVNGDLTGDLTLASTSHIDLGPVRLEFANGALHVTTNDSTNYPSIGFYADGFVASGGVGTGGGGSSYVLPIASSSELGGIKVGDGLSINSTTGALSVGLDYPKYVLCANEAAYNAIATKDSGTLYLIPKTS